MSEQFIAARISAPIIHPIELGRHAVTFDGLLWAALEAHHCDPVKARERLGTYLSFTEGVAHASQLRFGVKQTQRLTAAWRTTLGVMRSESDLTSDQFHPFGKKAKEPYPGIQVDGGPFRNRAKDHTLYHAPWAMFYVHGNAQVIVELLNFYIDCLGVNAYSGSGTVGVWSWEPVKCDQSLVDGNGNPARALPRALFESLSSTSAEIEEAAVEPPYHAATKQQCAVPERIVREIIQ